MNHIFADFALQYHADLHSKNEEEAEYFAERMGIIGVDTNDPDVRDNIARNSIKFLMENMNNEELAELISSCAELLRYRTRFYGKKERSCLIEAASLLDRAAHQLEE